MPRNNAKESAPAKTLNSVPDIDNDGLPDLPDEAFAAVEQEMEAKAAAGKGRRGKGKGAAALAEVPVSDMPDLDGPDLDPDMRDPVSSGDHVGLAASISEVADRLSDTANSMTNRMESLQGTLKQVLDLMQARFDEVQADIKNLKESMHPILRDALGPQSVADPKNGKLADAAHDKGSDEKTVGKLAKACGQSTTKAQQILDACYKFKSALPFGKVVEWMVGKCGLTEAQAKNFLAYFDLTAEEFDTIDGTDFPKL